MGSVARVWSRSGGRLPGGRVLVGLALAGALAAGCSGADPPDASPLPAGEGTQPLDPTAALDPITRDGCDKVWSFGTQAYAANITVDASPEDAEKLRAEVARTADEAATWMSDRPAMAADIKLLSAYAQQATKTSDHPDPPADVAAANQRLVDYLEGTCKLTLG
jgi:hypothetical protein